MTFFKPMAQQRAIDFIDHFNAECVKEGAFLGAANIERFPRRGGGGHVRILGCHTVRDGPIEWPFTFDGEILATLEVIAPHKFKKLPVPITSPRAISETKSRWKNVGDQKDAAYYLTRGIPRSTPHDEVYRIVIFLAHQVLKGRSRSQAESKMADWLETIGTLSSSITEGDTTKKDLLDPDKAAEYVGIAARMQEERGHWTPLAFRETRSPKGRKQFEVRLRSDTVTCTAPVAHLYGVLCEYVRVKKLDPARFRIDAETVGDLCGWEKRHAHRVISAAIKSGLVRLLKSAGFHAGHHPPPNTYAVAHRANVIQ